MAAHDLDAYLTIGRRGLLKNLGLYGLVTTGSALFAKSLWASPVFAEYPFKLGVAAGDPVPDGFVLWTRIAPEPTADGGMPHRPVPLRWEVATGRTSAELTDVVARGEAVAHPELGHSVHVEVVGLEPAREYVYRFEIGEGLARERSQIGRAVTLPAPGQPVPRLRFGVAGCQRYEDGYFTAFRHLAEEQLDFVFHYGDYIYEYRPRAVGELTRPTVRTHDLDEVYTLVDYRNRYGLYKSDPDLIAAHLSAPFLVSWDDHEIDNNWAGELKADFDDPVSRTVGVEFIATSISSGGDGSDRREETPKVLAANPHIKFFNDQRGYVSHEVTPEGWTAHYRVVQRVTVPDAPVTTRARFAVPAGEPRIEQA